MKLLLNLAIIMGLPLLFVGVRKESKSYSHSKAQYCNTRFEFCVNYPAPLLPEQRVSDNDDGVILKTTDRSSQVSVYGSFNVFKWTPKDLFEFTIKELPGGGGDIKVLTSLFGDDFYECAFLHGTSQYYHRGYFVKDRYVQMVAQTPVNRPEMMSRLREDVTVQLTVQ